MTYTARLNEKIVLKSGNWFSGFKADAESRTVIYTYHDRRRNGQVARHYTVSFKADLSTIESVTAVSSNGSRVEHFKTVSIRDDLAIILRSAVREAWEQNFAEEVEKVEPAKVSLSEKFEQINVKSEKQEAIMHGVLMLIVTLLFIVFTSTSLYLLAGGEATKETMDVLLTSGFAGIFLCILSMMKP